MDLSLPVVEAVPVLNNLSRGPTNAPRGTLPYPSDHAVPRVGSAGARNAAGTSASAA